MSGRGEQDRDRLVKLAAPKPARKVGSIVYIIAVAAAGHAGCSMSQPASALAYMAGGSARAQEVTRPWETWLRS